MFDACPEYPKGTLAIPMLWKIPSQVGPGVVVLVVPSGSKVRSDR